MKRDPTSLSLRVKYVLLCALGVATTASAETLWIPLFSGDQAYGVAQNVQTGEIQLAGRRLLGSSSAQIWSVSPSGEIADATASPLAGGLDCLAFRLSDQGRYAAGYSESFQAEPFIATRWQEGQLVAPISMGALSGGAPSSAAFDVANDGAVVGVSQGAFPFLWQPATGIQPLPGFLAPSAQGTANWIAPDARRIAGATIDGNSSLRAALWTAGGAAVLSLSDPVGLDSAVAGGSPNGRNFAGDLFDGLEFVAAVWIDGRLHTLLDDQGLPLNGIARVILNDGTAFGGATIGGVERGFIWNPIMGDQVQLLDATYEIAAGEPSPVGSEDVRDALQLEQHYHLAVIDDAGQGHYVKIPELATAPWEVGELKIDGANVWSWEAQSPTTEYDVIRGELTQLAASGSVNGANCVANGSGSTTLPDSSVGNPADGQIFYLLVRARNGLGQSEWGGDYTGVTRPDAAVCP